MRKLALALVLLLAALALLLVSSACGGGQQADLEQQNTALTAQVQSLQNEKAQLEQANSQLQGEKSQLAQANSQLQGEKSQLAQENDELAAQLAPPPSFLDRLYPPQAPFPVLLGEMFALAAPFEGIVIDLMQGDFQNLSTDFQAFQAQYERLRSEVVPEWQELLPLEPVQALGEALASQDPARVGAALGGAGAVCGQCHQAYQVKVQIQYHWPDFANVMLTDPVLGQSVPWADFMMNMALAFEGIGHDLSQGQGDRALEHYQNFNSYFNTLRQGCGNCHTTPRSYFVDTAVQSDIDALGQALQATPPDPAAIGGLIQKIGTDSCFNCHLVHFPAAKTKASWKQ